MTTKLQTIQQAVAAHFAAKEARRAAFDRASKTLNIPSNLHRLDANYNAKQDAAMSLLRDVLPLLELAAKIELNDGKMPEFQWYSLIQDYDTEVAKLTKDEA